MHQNIEGTIANSEVNASPISDIIVALQDILAHSQVIIPDLETPYSTFPNTDHSATAAGRSKSISAVITERQQQLDAVLQEVSGLESVMDGIKNLHQQLLQKKDNIVQSMNVHRGLVSALWRVPSEILSLIFVRCLPDTEHLLPSSKLAPMLLTRICRRWREVAVGMSSLWCRVIVDIDNDDWQRTAFCYNAWLERSRDRPLSLALKCSKKDATNLRNLLKPYTNQISSLHIILFINPLNTPDLLLNDLPVLQEFTLTASDPLWCTPSFVQCISRLPFTLRRFRVAGPSAFDFDRMVSCNPVWAHLTHVEIAICQPNLILQLLQLGPNLSSLEIGLCFYDEVPLTFEPFAHTNLQSLCISGACPMCAGVPDLFNALTLPNLRILEARYIRPWPHEELKTFLVRSSCPLESLIFGNGVTTTDKQREEYKIIIPFLDVVVDHMRSDCFGYRRLPRQYGIGRRRHV